MSGRHLSVAECAELLAVEHKTVRRLIERGELPALRVGRVLRIDPAALDALAYQPAPPGGEHSPRPARPRPVAGEFSKRARGAIR